MRNITLTATAAEIEKYVRGEAPEIDKVMTRVRGRVPYYKREVYKYQAMILYLLAKQYNCAGANILEIGTAAGYTAACLAEAAPEASIETLNPSVHEIPQAAKNLAPYENVALLPLVSWDYLAAYNGPKLDLIFVDGDHKKIALDLPWWKHIKKWGLIAFTISRHWEARANARQYTTA